MNKKKKSKSKNGKNGSDSEKEEGVKHPLKVRFKEGTTEYTFLGVNPDHPDRIVIKEQDGDMIGTVDRDCYEPVNFEWEDIKDRPVEN